MTDYDFTINSLIHPCDTTAIFEGVSMGALPFEPGASGLSLTNALWLSNASQLAYCDQARISSTLDQAGLGLMYFFDRDGTQGFIAGAEAEGGDFAILAFRGSQHGEWVDIRSDFDFRLTELDGTGAMVHRGFNLALEKAWDDLEPRLTGLVRGGVAVWITGHSLGAALATIAASRVAPAALYTFGSPRVGNAGFCGLLSGIDAHRFVNCTDLTSGLPPSGLGYDHAGTYHLLTHRGHLITEPTRRQEFDTHTKGYLGYWTTPPRIHADKVPIRPLADHTPNNYTAALWRAWSATTGD